MFCSSMRSEYFPLSPLAPGRSRAIMRRCSPSKGVQRSWTLRKKTIPLGPQYSFVFGKTSPSMKTLFVWPARNCPSEPQACRRRIVVWPASTPTPKRSNSNSVLTSPRLVGSHPRTPKRVWRTLNQVLPLSPNSFGERRELRGALDVEPVRIYLLEVVDRVDHGKAVDLHARPRVLRSGRRCAVSDLRAAVAASAREQGETEGHACTNSPRGPLWNVHDNSFSPA